MKKQYPILLFILLIIAQLSVATRMIIQQEQIIQKGQAFLFKTAPVDPYDPFRGKYITLRFEAEDYVTQDKQQWKAGEQAFVSLNTDPAGFAKVIKLSKTLPKDETPFFKATIGHYYPQDSVVNIAINFPFNRYYMEESKAPEAEKIYREAFLQSREDIYAVVFINQGQSVLEDVKIGESSIKDLVKKPLEK